MEIPANVRIFFESLAGEPKKGRLLTISSHGYYEVILHLAGGSFRALLPIEKTFIVAAEADQVAEAGLEVER